MVVYLWSLNWPASQCYGMGQREGLQEDDIGQTGEHGAAERWVLCPWQRTWQDYLGLTLE